jgi:putative ABC transport system substrate-binding protein
MELLHEMVPAAARVAMLVDPTFPLTEFLVRDAETAARAMGLQVKVLSASTSREINAAFANFVRERPDVLYVGTSRFFISRRIQLTQLAARRTCQLYSPRSSSWSSMPRPPGCSTSPCRRHYLPPPTR